MSPTAVSPGERLAVVGLVAAIFLLSLLTYFHLGEDAFISLRYSRNFAAGMGLVYNAGEWVEGYSNLLWVLVMAPFEALGLRAHVWARLLSTGAFAALAVAGWWAARRLAPRGSPRWSAWWLPVAIAVEPLLHYHDDQGLETVPYAAMLGGALLLLGAGAAPWAAGILAGAAALTRPEGIVFAMALAPVLLLPVTGSRRPDATQWRAAAVYTAIPLALFLGQMMLRRALYGEWVPNTVIAKRSGGPGGVEQVLVYTATRAGLPLLALAGMLWGLTKPALRPLALASLATAGVAVLFQIRAGGLLNIGFRYLVPLFLPVVIGCWMLVLCLGRARGVAAVALMVAMPVLLWGDGPAGRWLRGNTDAPRSRFHHRLFEAHTWDFAGRWERFFQDPIFINAEAGRWAAANLPHDALLGADQMGMLGYHAPQPIVDLLGLMDAHIARHGLSLDYLAQRAPQYLIIEALDDSDYWPAPWRDQPHVPHLRALAGTAEFRALYRPRWFLLTNTTFARKGFMVYIHNSVDDGEPMERIGLGADDAAFEKAWRVL